jgi:hypothetical protein
VSEIKGGGIGRALSHILAETFVAAHASTVDHTQAARVRATTGIMEHMESELAPTLDRVFSDYLERDDLPDGLRAIFERVGHPDHQSDLLLQLVAVVSAVISGMFQIGQPYVQAMMTKLWAENRYVPLSAADAATAVERAILTQEQGDAWAAMSGFDPLAFTQLVSLSGEPPGLEEMNSLWRRGLLAESELDRMIAYSRVRLEWAGYVKLLAQESMTPGDALEATLKGVVDSEAGAEFFRIGGGLPDQFQTLLDTTGDAIGVEAAANLWNHGLITDAQMEAVVLHSRINPTFEPMAELLRHHWLAPFQISEALTKGTITPDLAAEWLLADGYPADQVAALAGTGAENKVAPIKALTESQLASMYETGLISKAVAESSLEALGYNLSESDMLLALYEEKRILSMANAAVTATRAAYLKGRVDDPTATTQLTSLGIDADAITQYLAVWKVEAASELKALTPAQVGAMVKAGYITTADATARWAADGYDATDAGLLLAYYTGTAPTGSPAAEAAPSGGSTDTSGTTS